MTRLEEGGPTTGELVYVVGDDVPPEAIATSLQSLLRTRRHAIVRHQYTVLDTFDGRVQRAGARLTQTSANGASIVTWQPAGTRRQLATKLAEPLNFVWDLPDSALQRTLAPVIGVRRLLALADAEQRGALLEVLDDRRKTVARLRIESGRVRRPMPRGPWRPLPTILTLAGLCGYEDAWSRLVPVIESRPGVASCQEGLHGVVLRHAGHQEMCGPSSLAVDLLPTVRADIGARQIHLALLRLLALNEPGLRANLDTEFLHDFRVALRRARSLLAQLKYVFTSDATEHFSTEMSWIGRLTGPTRDMDVLILALRARDNDVPDSDMAEVIAFLGQLQTRERHSIIEALDSLRYRTFLSDWQTYLEQRADPEPAANATLPLADVVCARAWKLSRRIARRAEAIDDNARPEQFHEVRIDAKKLRYLIDVTPAFYHASDLDCVLVALKVLQRALGDFNDAQVQQNLLLECGRALGAAGGPPSAILALGRLAEIRRQRQTLLQSQVVETLEGFRGHATRSACRRAFKRDSRGKRVQ